MDPEISKSYIGYVTLIPIAPCNITTPLISSSEFALDLPTATEERTSIVFALMTFALILPFTLMFPLTSNAY